MFLIDSYLIGIVTISSEEVSLSEFSEFGGDLVDLFVILLVIDTYLGKLACTMEKIFLRIVTALL